MVEKGGGGGHGILDKKGLGCTGGLLGESTIMEIGIHPSTVKFEQHIGASSTKLRPVHYGWRLKH